MARRISVASVGVSVGIAMLGVGKERRMEQRVRDEVNRIDDAFLTAELVFDLMVQLPVDTMGAPEGFTFTATPRFRLERLWMACLYVAVEGWRARTGPVQQFFERIEEAVVLESIVTRAEDGGLLDSMRACRDYMFHRDRRGMWDDGRLAPIGRFRELRELHDQFSIVFERARPLR